MYLLHGKLTAREGHAQELADILLKASEMITRFPGCKLYVIGRDEQPNDLYITEIWESKQAHDDSLKDEEVRQLISRAMPIIDGIPQRGQELTLLGGHGI